MKKTLLIDFDGVIFKNKVIERKLIKRIDRYCGEVLNIKNKKISKLINRELYLGSGHTILGLKKIGKPLNLKEFNDKIYNFDYKELYEDITPENVRDIENLKELYYFCQSHDIDLKIWSNSPSYWCKNFICYITSDLRHIEIHNNHNCSYLLKPERDSYTYIESILKSDLIFFVDDKLYNLLNTPDNQKWISIHFNDNFNEKVSDRFIMIKDLVDMKRILI